jgi:hypothetical protein
MNNALNLQMRSHGHSVQNAKAESLIYFDNVIVENCGSLPPSTVFVID